MKKRIISAVLSAAMLGTSVFSVPFVNATVVETYNIQVKPILNEFINENYKGDAELHDIYDGLIQVVFRKTELDEPKFDAEAIRSEFDKLFEEKNIDPATVEVVFLKPDKAPKTTDDNGRIKKLLESFIDQNYHDRARICGVGEDYDAIYAVIFNTDFSLDSKAMNDIWNDFEKLLKENDIDPKLVQVRFLEGVVVASVNTGDVDLNGTIDVTDLTELSLALVGDKELAADQKLAADIDGDGTVSIADLARLQQYLSKKIDKF
ncbi:MAG: dockerin type I repeat-containing protein [Oscillospiraceae bacterium]|nr:dockerin type I repeat-containing protein [Oscillospiraceae bacterium]